jgi:hypothetical protein
LPQAGDLSSQPICMVGHLFLSFRIRFVTVRTSDGRTDGRYKACWASRIRNSSQEHWNVVIYKYHFFVIWTSNNSECYLIRPVYLLKVIQGFSFITLR